MPSKIQVLPESIANQIAAGEVVQRPASAVKELLENAIDAGASIISLYIKNGGSTHIQVDDNGSGMNAFDARMCWERHATSKISQAADLYALNTLGFRGEALASIASVSDIEMKTKTAEEAVGTRLVIKTGTVEVEENTACNNGTSITIKNLFYNIPARKNFLKSISVETKHIFDEFQRIALSYPSVELSFYNQDKLLTHLEPGSLKERISSLLRAKEDDLIETKEETEIVSINGFIGDPKLAKKTRGNQFLFANGRFIKDNYLNHAIFSAYEGLLEAKSYPFFVLFLEVDPAKIDVNIHPTKHEVKFEDSRHVYTLINAVIKKSLGSHLVIPTSNQLENIGSMNTSYSPSLKMTPPDKRFNPFGENKTRTRTEWEKLDELLNTPLKGTRTVVPSENSPLIVPAERQIAHIFQLEEKYIVAKVGAELLLIDQHRAHKEVLLQRYNTGKLSASQQLLFPNKVELSTQNYLTFQEVNEDLLQMGFDISDFGNNNVIINGLPSDIAKEDGQTILLQVLEDYQIHIKHAKTTKQVAIQLAGARHAAIRAGRKLDTVEMKTLVNDLLQCENSARSSDGKTISVKLAKDSIQRFFN